MSTVEIVPATIALALGYKPYLEVLGARARFDEGAVASPRSGLFAIAERRVRAPDQDLAELIELSNRAITWPVAFSSLKGWFATAASNGRIQISEKATGIVLQDLSAQEDTASALAFSADGERLLRASAQGTITAWDLGVRRDPLRFQAYRLPITGAAFRNDASSLVTVSVDGTLRVWETATGKQVGGDVFVGSTTSDLLFSESSSSVFLLSADGKVRVWEEARGLRTVVEAPPGCLTFLASISDPARILVGGKSGYIYLLEEESLLASSGPFQILDDHRDHSSEHEDLVAIQVGLFLQLLSSEEVVALSFLTVRDQVWESFSTALAQAAGFTELTEAFGLVEDAPAFTTMREHSLTWADLWRRAREHHFTTGIDILSAASEASRLRLQAVDLQAAALPAEQLERTVMEQEASPPRVHWITVEASKNYLTLSIKGRSNHRLVTSVYRRDIYLLSMQLALKMRFGASLSEVKPHSSLLYRLLIEPIKDYVEDGDILVFSPQGPLGLVPFSALWNEEAQQFLIQEHPVAIAPDLDSSQASLGHRSTEASRDLLLIADPEIGDSNETRGLRQLDFARDEARYLTSLYGTDMAEVLVGPDATREAICRSSKESRVVQFSTHALFDWENPESSKLLLAKGNDGRSSFFDAGDIESCDFSGTVLVVLAGCATAVTHPSGEGTYPLVEPFLESGVPFVLATHWEVEDSEAARLSEEFHNALSSGLSAVRALQRAQLSLLVEAGEHSSRISSWATFSLFVDSLGSLEDGLIDARTPVK